MIMVLFHGDFKGQNIILYLLNIWVGLSFLVFFIPPKLDLRAVKVENHCCTGHGRQRQLCWLFVVFQAFIQSVDCYCFLNSPAIHTIVSNPNKVICCGILTKVCRNYETLFSIPLAKDLEDKQREWLKIIGNLLKLHGLTKGCLQLQY